MKEEEAIRNYFNKENPCRNGHMEHTNECPYCVAVQGYKLDKKDRFRGRKQ